MSLQIALSREQEFALRYLEDLIYEFLMEHREPCKVSEIMAALGGSIAADLSLKFVRDILTASDRFLLHENKWDLAVKYILKGYPLEGAIEKMLQFYGKPAGMETLARFLALIFGHTQQYFREIIPRILQPRSNKYLKIDETTFGLTEWFLDPNYEDEEDIIFYNFFEESPDLQEALSQFNQLNLNAQLEEVELSHQILNSFGHPLHNKILSFLIWKLKGKEFEPLKHFHALAKDDRFLLLSGLYWCEKGWQATLVRQLKQLEEQFKEKPAVVPEVKEAVEEVPILITSKDLESLINYLKGRQRPQRIAQLLEVVFEIFEDDPGFSNAFKSLSETLSQDPRFRQVGKDLWVPQELIPPVVFEIPRDLRIPELSFKTLEGEEIDELLVDEGFEGDLSKFVHDPHLEDIDEEEEVPEESLPKESPDKIQYTPLYHHLVNGTMKLRKIDRNFFGDNLQVLWINGIDAQGNEYHLWVNNKHGLIYGLEDWYKKVNMPVGGVFYLQKTGEESKYLLDYKEEKDKLSFIKESRLKELEDLRKVAEKKEFSLFDIICEIMSHYSKGIHPLTLYSEANVVRRCSKRMIASDLSLYYCFYTKKETGLWVYNERERAKGKKKAKKKYLLKPK